MTSLDPEQLSKLDETAHELAARAGEILLDRFQSVLSVQYKDEYAHDPVTEVDRAIEDMVRAEVGKRFPEHGVIGEERADGGPKQADVVWVIDPLDGTSNFINGLGMFACSIGVLERGAPVAGALFLPTNRYMRPGVYHAHSGSGLHFDGERVDLSSPGFPASSRLSTVPSGTGGVTGPAGRRFGVVRTLGSIAVELALAAEGSVQMALFEGLARVGCGRWRRALHGGGPGSLHAPGAGDALAPIHPLRPGPQGSRDPSDAAGLVGRDRRRRPGAAARGGSRPEPRAGCPGDRSARDKAADSPRAAPLAPESPRDGCLAGAALRRRGRRAAPHRAAAASVA